MQDALLALLCRLWADTSIHVACQICSWDMGVRSIPPPTAECSPRPSGSRVCLIAVCVASLWQSAPPVDQKICCQLRQVNCWYAMCCSILLQVLGVFHRWQCAAPCCTGLPGHSGSSAVQDSLARVKRQQAFEHRMLWGCLLRHVYPPGLTYG
jgi:hypothetical protein